MATRQSNIQEDTYFRLLRILEANPRITQRELASNLGISVGGLNYCLRALIDKGYVKMNNFSRNENKLHYMYLLTPSGLAQKAALTKSFLRRKLAEYEALRAEIEALTQEGRVASGD